MSLAHQSDSATAGQKKNISIGACPEVSTSTATATGLKAVNSTGAAAEARTTGRPSDRRNLDSEGIGRLDDIGQQGVACIRNLDIVGVHIKVGDHSTIPTGTTTSYN